jgi:hypothetical protein
MKWQTLEALVRDTAQLIWECPATAETINGVKCDCVLKRATDNWVLIEISKTDSLYKLRTDLAKFATIRPFLFSQSIFAKCIFVCESDPPPSLVESGNGLNVEVLSVHQLTERFFNYARYAHARNNRSFGSAVNPFTGEKDGRSYIPVMYSAKSGGDASSIENIIHLIKQKKRMILLGSYGTGKSRCIQELFSRLQSEASKAEIIPLAIDLKEQWGVRRASEILRRHFDDLGLSGDGDSIVKLLGTQTVCLLLDGFDEVGSQSWSNDPATLKEIRAKALSGIKDLIKLTKGAVFITGREHYFNTDEEMFRSLAARGFSLLAA